jgi:hypothetical protein
MVFHEGIMNVVDIKNESFIEVLESCRDFFDADFLKNFNMQDAGGDAERWVNDEYRKYIMDLGPDHNGFPASSMSYSLTHKQYSIKSRTPPEEALQIEQRLNSFHENMIAEISAHRNALFMVYPPGGYIGWHNNANASGYNVLLTWSAAGDGWWKHVDIQTDEVVTIPDKPGWQCKYGYYGSYKDNPESLLYHAAYTNCWRATIAYVFNRDETGKKMCQMLLEELSTP